MTKTGTRTEWAIFDENGDHYAPGVYTSEADADNDMWGRPEGVHVAAACQCVGPVREAVECSSCGFEDDGDE